MKTFIKYTAFLSAFSLMAIFVTEKVHNLYNSVTTRFAHNVISRELARDDIRYEVDEKRKSVTAYEATDSDLKKALYFERVRAAACEQAFDRFEQFFTENKPAL